MFSLKRTYLSLILNPLQKLFRSPSSRSQEFFTPSCNLVDFSSSPALSLPYRLKVALLFHRVKEGIERSRAEVYFEPVPDLQVDLVSPPGLGFEKAEYDEVKMVLDQPLSPRLIEVLVQ